MEQICKPLDLPVDCSVADILTSLLGGMRDLITQAVDVAWGQSKQHMLLSAVLPNLHARFLLGSQLIIDICVLICAMLLNLIVKIITLYILPHCYINSHSFTFE